MATNTESIKAALQKSANEMLPDTTVTLGYMEHYMDLIGKIVSSLAHKEASNLTDEEKDLVEKLDSMLKYSSIDFDNLNDPLQSYKVPKAIEAKQRTRMVQRKYLQAQITKGVFGK